MSQQPILKSHRRPDVTTTVVAVRNVRFGDGSYPVIAGPVAVEGEAQISAVADAVAEAGGSILRAGTFRAETSPYSYKGMGVEGLWLLEKEAHDRNLATVTEVLEPGQAEFLAEHVDMLEVGPDNMQNFVLLQAAGATMKPVILHRGPSATVDEWLMAAEYVMAKDNNNVILCERGSRGFDPRTSDTLDISAIPVVQRLSHLPVIIDPSPADGNPDILRPLALAGRSAGADGLLVSVHPDPANALAGNGGQLDLPGFAVLMEALGIPSLRDEIDRIDRELVKLIARRLHSSVEIAGIKVVKGLPLRSADREAELIQEARDDAASLGVDPSYMEELMTVVLEHSRRAQAASVGAEEDAAAS